MLRNIPRVILPDLMKYMMEMGHSDTIVITDANFPVASHANRVIRLDTDSTCEVLEAVLKFFPLDDFVDNPVKLMRNRPQEPVPVIWDEYKKILLAHDEEKAFRDFCFLDRFEFYHETEKAYVVVQTAETTRYANILLQKGVL